MASVVLIDHCPPVDAERRHPSLLNYKPTPSTGFKIIERAVLSAVGATQVMNDDEYAGDDEYESGGADDVSVGAGKEEDDEDSVCNDESASSLSLSLSPVVSAITSPAIIERALFVDAPTSFYTPHVAVQLQISPFAVTDTLPALPALRPASFSVDTDGLDSDDTSNTTDDTSSSVLLTLSDDEVYWVGAFIKELSVVDNDIFEE